MKTILEDLTAILFCADISRYDQFEDDDPEYNKLQNTIRLFENTTKSRFFDDSMIVVFFTKKDLFVDKLANVSLNVCFPEYNGSQDFNEAIEYLKTRFRSKVSAERKVYFQTVSAVNGVELLSAVDHVFDLMLINKAILD